MGLNQSEYESNGLKVEGLLATSQAAALFRGAPVLYGARLTCSNRVYHWHGVPEFEYSETTQNLFRSPASLTTVVYVPQPTGLLMLHTTYAAVPGVAITGPLTVPRFSLARWENK